jgi:hypothetical protein
VYAGCGSGFGLADGMKRTMWMEEHAGNENEGSWRAAHRKRAERRVSRCECVH